MIDRFCVRPVRLSLLLAAIWLSGAFVTMAANTLQFTTNGFARNENVGDAALTVTRVGDTNSTCSVNWVVTGGSATVTADYSPSSGTLNFGLGETSKIISLLIVDDAVVETNETVSLVLSNAANATIASPSNSVLTILDNDGSNAPPVIQFVSNSYGYYEDAGAVAINVERVGNTNGTTTVQWGVTGGTATAGSDYTGGTNGTLTFLPGQAIRSLPITIVNDASAESSETVNFLLGNATNGTLGSPITNTLTIFDGNYTPPVIQFISSSYNRAESQSFTLMNVERSGNLTATSTVQWAVMGGTATPGADYTGGTNGTLTFPPGLTLVSLPIMIVEDLLVESDETVSFVLSSPTNATLGAQIISTLTIFDNDFTNQPAMVQFVTNSFSRSESAGAVSMIVERTGETGGTVRVDWVVTGGSATPGADFLGGTSGTLIFNPGETNQSLILTIVNDALPESNETVTLVLSNVNNAIISSMSNAVLTIVDNDAVPLYSVSGRVLDRATNGPGLAGATVRLTSGSTTNSVASDASGNYAFSNVAAGSYTVTPSKTNYGFAPTNIVINVTTNATLSDFVGMNFAIVGQVRDGTNLPVKGLGAVAMKLSGSLARTNYTDTNGFYFFTNLPPGTYTVTPTTNNFSFQPTNTTLALTSLAAVTNNCTNVVHFIGIGPASNCPPAQLAVKRTNNQVIITWTNAAYQLQATATLPAIQWTNIPGSLQVTQPVSSAAQFYRLKCN